LISRKGAKNAYDFFGYQTSNGFLPIQNFFFPFSLGHLGALPGDILLTPKIAENGENEIIGGLQSQSETPGILHLYAPS